MRDEHSGASPVSISRKWDTKWQRVNTLLRRNGLRDALIVYGGYSFRFISPLLLYPLLTRRLGAEAFGIYAAAYSLALMLSVIVEYGFNLTGTRDVAVAPNAAARGQIASRIVFARLILLPAAMAVGGGLALINPVFKDSLTVAGVAILLGCAQGSTAFWYFQGVGKVLTAVALEIGGQVAALAATILLVRTAQDLTLAVGLQCAGFLSCALLGVTLMFRQAPAGRISLTESTAALRDGFAIFLSRAALVIYTAGSVYLLAALAGPFQAALYGAAERIVGAFAALLRPLSAVVLPRLAIQMSLDASTGLRHGLAIGAATSGLFLIIAVILAVAAPHITLLMFGDGFKVAAPTLQLLAASLPLMAMNTVLGSQVMIALRLDRSIMYAVLIGGAANLVLAFALASIWSASGMAMARLATESIILLSYLITLRRFRHLIA